MIRFTEAQMEALKPIEKELGRAYRSNYKRSTTYSVNKMVSDYVNEATGHVEARNLGCGTCVLNLFRKAGEIYFNTLEEMKEKEILSDGTEPQQVTDSLPEKKNNKGRKKVANNVQE